MQSLARGLSVLDFIARSEGVTFTAIVEATGLSKAVVHRIIAELLRSGFVFRNRSNKKFFGAPLIAASPSGSYARILLSAASKPMDWLVKKISWPSDLFIHEGRQMVMIESSRPSSPFHLRWSRIGRNAPMLLSSVGRALLAEMSPEERQTIYDELKAEGEWKSQIGWLKRPLDQIIDEASERGYAERERSFAGPVLERSGETSFAVAIRAGSVIIGAINIWWPSSADPDQTFISRFKEPLLECRSKIETNLSICD